MKTIVLLVLCMAGISVYPQQFTEPCGTMLLLEEQLKSNPGLAEHMAEAEERIQQFIARNKDIRSSADLITIPVVFHVVHNGELVGTGRNISDAQILSQLEVINEDFQRLNGDTVNLRPIFKDVAGNPKIEFCLATVTPAGIPTNGINRIDGGRDEWPLSDIDSVLMPSTIWDSKLYLNFWVVDFGPNSNLAGYAQYPWKKNPLTDGIVVSYKSVGRPPDNPFSGYGKYGRTATHEIGHWLNLLHIWGDGPCMFDDWVDDTPHSDEYNYYCPVGVNRCIGSPTDFPDMVENYMDYTRGDCKNTFTKGQVERMRAAINLYRAELFNSLGCISSPTFTFTGKVIDTATGLGVPFAKIILKGAFTYRIQADSTGQFALPHQLLEGTYQMFAGAWGYHTTHLSSDTLSAKVANYTIGLGRGYYDDFVLDQGWTEEGNAQAGRWTREIPVGTLNDGQPFNPEVDISGDLGESCFVTGNGGGEAGDDDVDSGKTILRSPYFDVTGYSDPKLAFYRWFQVGGGDAPSTDSLIITLTNGLGTDTLEVVTGASNDIGQWVYREFQISEYLTLTDSMQVILQTSDRPGSDNLVEGAFDMFQVADSFASMPRPTASFTFDKDTICGGDTVRFTNTSINAPNTIEWYFAGGIPARTTALHPLVAFQDEGDYGATLIVGNAGGFDTLEMTSLIHVYSSPDLTLTTSPILCHRDTSSLRLGIANGTPPFQIKWNTGHTGRVLRNPWEATFTVTVTDSNGCGEELGYTVVKPSELTGDAVQVVPDDGTGTGEAVVRPVGGTPPYTFKWNNANSSTDSLATGLTAGTYLVTITDSNGCRKVPYVAISLSEFIRARVTPNPVSDYTKVQFDYSGNDPIVLIAYDLLGQVMHRIEIPASKTISAELSVATWASGLYRLEISNGISREVVPLVKVNK